MLGTRSGCWRRWLGVLAGVLLAVGARATPIDPLSVGMTYWLGDPFAAAVYDYNGASDAFTAQTQLGGAALAALGLPPPGGTMATDIFGSFSLSASIDASGALLGGTFELIASSAALGIDVPTILLAGRLDYGTFAGGSGFMYQLMGDITVVDPVFAAVVGGPQQFLLNLNGLTACLEQGPADPFSCSFDDYASSLSSPDLFMAPAPQAISAPGTLLLALLGAAIVGRAALWRRRLRRAPP